MIGSGLLPAKKLPVLPTTTLPLASIPKLLTDAPPPNVPMLRFGTYTVSSFVPVIFWPPIITDLSALFITLPSPPITPLYIDEITSTFEPPNINPWDALDILDKPENGGGIRLSYSFLKSYLNSDLKNLKKLLEYAFKMKNKVIFKRLGFLLSEMQYNNLPFIDRCRVNISKGYSHLDPTIKGKKIIKKWRLWVPEGIKFNDW